MPWIGTYKLSDAMPKPPRSRGKRGGKPGMPHEVVAEQIRESQEMHEARNNEASIRDRMVDIGRGNLQAGRQGP